MGFTKTEVSQSSNTRTVHLDALHGIAILSMITGHAFVFLAGNASNAINDFVITWHMPLFAAISGFVSYRERIPWSSASIKVKKRLMQQILPTIILCTIWTSTLSPATWQETIDSMYKGVYWHTFVALELYFYVSILLAVKNKPKIRTIQSVVFIIMILGTPVFEKSLFSLGISPSCRWLVPNLLNLLPFFFLGCLMKANEHIFSKLLSRSILTSSIIFCLLGLSIFTLHDGIHAHHSVFIRFISTFCPISAFLLLSLTIGKRYEHSKSLIRLSRHGKDSLEIYLLHFFILATLGYVVDLSSITEICPDILTYIILLSISIPVASTCLYMTKVLGKIGIYRYSFFTDKSFVVNTKRELSY